MENGTTATRLDEEHIDESVNSVHVTKDYDKFSFNSKNRTVNPAHLDKLQASIKKTNLLEAQPITVNADFEIIDGQHRFTAAKNLGLPVYYIKLDGLTIEDAITLNINTKNWGWRDYLQYWIRQEKQDYIYFKQYMRRYNLSYSVCTGLLGLGQATDGNKLTDFFNAGKFRAKHKEFAEDFGEKILAMKEYGSFANDRSFVLAFDEASRMDEYDHQTFMKKLEMAPDKFTKCSNKENYLRMMEDVINYHNHGQRIRLY